MASYYDPKSDPQFLSQLGGDQLPALAFVELTSISRGLFLTDVITKKAEVSIITSQPVSSGKHVILYFGDVASVQDAHQAALEQVEETLVKETLIPGVHPQLVPYLNSLWEAPGKVSDVGESVGIVESVSLSASILAADSALKTAEVSLVRMRLGQGIGGKAYFVLTGRLEDVAAALESAEQCLNELESLCRVDLIPQPMNEVFVHF